MKSVGACRPGFVWRRIWCGLMPHPERHIDPTQHPMWTRREPVEYGDGFAVFRNAVRYFS